MTKVSKFRIVHHLFRALQSGVWISEVHEVLALGVLVRLCGSGRRLRVPALRVSQMIIAPLAHIDFCHLLLWAITQVLFVNTFAFLADLDACVFELNWIKSFRQRSVWFSLLLCFFKCWSPIPDKSVKNAYVHFQDHVRLQHSLHFQSTSFRRQTIFAHVFTGTGTEMN